MFWACFSGETRGPSLRLGKEWKSVNRDRYCERTAPLVHGWIPVFPDLQFMQDGAPSHAVGFTLGELQEKSTTPIYWPLYPPDLNPIEAVWNKLKVLIELHCPDLPGVWHRTYDQLRGVAHGVWE